MLIRLLWSSTSQRQSKSSIKVQKEYTRHGSEAKRSGTLCNRSEEEISHREINRVQPSETVHRRRVSGTDNWEIYRSYWIISGRIVIGDSAGRFCTLYLNKTNVSSDRADKHGSTIRHKAVTDPFSQLGLGSQWYANAKQYSTALIVQYLRSAHVFVFSHHWRSQDFFWIIRLNKSEEILRTPKTLDCVKPLGYIYIKYLPSSRMSLLELLLEVWNQIWKSSRRNFH